MTEDVILLKEQISMCLKHDHVSEASPDNRLGTDGRDRIIKNYSSYKGQT